MRKISGNDIQLVQNLIERCLQLYMDKKGVVNTLQTQAGIEPGFTSLVWQKLEEQNPEFFNAYKTRLKIQEQVQVFNHLLEQQMHICQKYKQQHLHMSHGAAIQGGVWGGAYGRMQGMPGGRGAGTAPGIPTSYMPNSYMMAVAGTSGTGEGVGISSKGSFGHLGHLEVPQGMSDVRMPGAEGYMPVPHTNSNNNLNGMIVGPSGVPITDQMSNGFIGSFNDSSNPQFPRAIPRNLSLGEMSFEMTNPDTEDNELSMLGNIEQSKDNRLSFPFFDQVRDSSALNGNEGGDNTIKLPRNFSLSDMVNFS